MQLEGLLLEEYKTVRQESLEAAGRVQSVAQYLFAAGGVAITVGLLAADKDKTVGAAVLMSLIPLVVVLGIAMMTLELQRVLGARLHLRNLETRINTLLGFPEAGLSWEAARLTPKMRPLNPLPIVFVVAVAGIVVIGPGIGGLVLRDQLTWWYGIGAVADVVVAVAVVVVALRKYPQLRALEKTGDTRSSGPLGG